MGREAAIKTPLSILFLWLGGPLGVIGCGPFFPDSMLSGNQSAVDVPQVSYLDELRALVREPSETSGIPSRAGPDLLPQLPMEVEELQAALRQAGVDEAGIESRLATYREVRTALLKGIRPLGPRAFPPGRAAASNLPENPLGPGFPLAIREYVEAARLHAIGRTDAARILWKRILRHPPDVRRLRSVWAAWMLAKTAADNDECRRWYRVVDEEFDAGGADILNLRAAAWGWRGRLAPNPVRAAHCYLTAFRCGRALAAIDLRNVCRKILDPQNTRWITQAARDEQVRRLVNLEIYATADGPRYGVIVESEAGQEFLFPPRPWLEALEALPDGPIQDAEMLAWALYSQGRFEDSRRWLALADPADPKARWLQAKFDLREGRVAPAAEHLRAVVRQLSAGPHWAPRNDAYGSNWTDGGFRRLGQSQGRLLAETGVVALARSEYAMALDAFVEAGYHSDAAYVAENLMNADELLAYTRRRAPDWSREIQAYWQGEPNEEWGTWPGPVQVASCLEKHHYSRSSHIGTTNDWLRCLLGRRLARLWRFDDAREWIPRGYRPLFDHYVVLHRARRSGRYSGELLAAIGWRQARIHRSYGMELFGTEGAPDGAFSGGNFRALDAGLLRSQEAEEPRIPEVVPDEIRRFEKHLPETGERKRFHYRYTAAGIAWKVAKALPDNHPQLARLYNTTGLWLADRDPKAADRFYQALVRRCAATPEGKAAKEKRWFLRDLPPPDEWADLPPRLRP